MSGPKITVIGAGSYFFGKPVIHKLATSPILASGTLALVDTNPRVLQTMVDLATRAFAHTDCGVRVVSSTDRRDVMPDSDFVVLTFSAGNAYYRGLETMIAAKHGIRMCSSDTIGPGGIFRALREVPHALAMARDVEELAPQAWLISFVNPTTVLGMALRRYAPAVKSFALCDSQYEPYFTLNWCKAVGILPAEATSVPPEIQNRLDLAVGGVNHCTFMLRFSYAGQDYLPRVREIVAERAEAGKSHPSEKSKQRYNDAYALQLFDLYGVYPTVVSHAKEYVPYFQGYGVAPVEPEPIRLFDAEERAQEMAAAWAVTEQYASGQLAIDGFLRTVHDDHASDIMESMWGDLGKVFFINGPNRGAIINLPDDAYLELRCHVDLQGYQPLPVGSFPRGALALQHQLLDTHELTAEAAVTGDRATLRRAMLTDPICNNIADADNCIAELLAAERDALPSYWHERAPSSSIPVGAR
jgi:alpha-galactosidase